MIATVNSQAMVLCVEAGAAASVAKHVSTSTGKNGKAVAATAATSRRSGRVELRRRARKTPPSPTVAIATSTAAASTVTATTPGSETTRSGFAGHAGAQVVSVADPLSEVREEQQRGDVVQRGAEREQADEPALGRGAQPAAGKGDEHVEAQRDVDGLAHDAQRDEPRGIGGLEREGHGGESEQDEQRPEAARGPPAPPREADQRRDRDQVPAVGRREARVGEVVAAEREPDRHGDDERQRERRRPPRRERRHTGAPRPLVREDRGQRKRTGRPHAPSLYRAVAGCKSTPPAAIPRPFGGPVAVRGHAHPQG